MGATVKVAAAQMAPVFMDREATVDKICGLILEAGALRAGFLLEFQVFFCCLK